MEKFLKKKNTADCIRSWNENPPMELTKNINLEKPIIQPQTQDQRENKDYKKIYKTSLNLENKLKIASMSKFIVLLICILLILYKVQSVMILSIFLILESSYIYYYSTIRKQINNTIYKNLENKAELSYIDLFYNAIDFYKMIVSYIIILK